MLRTSFQEVLDLNHGWDTDQSKFIMVLLIPHHAFAGKDFSYAMTTSLQILSKSSLIFLPSIWHQRVIAPGSVVK
jgi:hypothetical protein